MREEIKYEAVFGDQSLFDDDFSPNAFFVIEFNDGNKSFFSEKLEDCDVGFSKCDWFNIAMRRIIKTPVWTIADQKAGRLPEVGCSAVFMLNDGVIPEGNIYNWENGDEIEILKVFSGAVACVYNKSKKWAANISMTSIKPIETPEERGQRLRFEWSRKAVSTFYANHHDESVALVGCIYDALLSGELQAPKGE